MDRRGISYQRQLKVPVLYKGDLVGNHRLDFLVENAVVVELKAAKAFEEVHISTVVSYLAATKLSVGLLLNFSTPRVECRRVAR
ncbi:MAG TPA: GxxExxY protein, partial [Candidatus Sulfotelmatobacter sp.]|nr:GxxExxY protein [Candidatus Sulfotelmatobacter sp.]